VPAVYETILRHRFTAAGQKFGSMCYPVPVEIPAGHSIRLTSNAAVIVTDAGIMGIVVPLALV
jgi:hypothetical protein